MLFHLGVAIQFSSFEVSIYVCFRMGEGKSLTESLLLYLIIANLSLFLVSESN